MNQEQRITFINSQIACANAEVEGMKAENQYRVDCGHSIAYGEEAFYKVAETYGLTHNQVIEYLSNNF